MREAPPRKQPRDNGGAILVGLILVLVGGWLLVQRLVPGLEGRVVWPAIFVVIGLALVIGSLRGRRGA